MGSQTDIYHKAARDGYLDLLREATRKDADRADEDGMTPTLWAAFHGNLDALRMLIGRGGNPDKSDLQGNTALHCASANGHINCVTFLVSFGANMWALDNDLHTPLDVAVLNNRHAIVKYLDEMIAQQSILNKKVVRKLKEKSVLEAHKRVKKYEKLQQKAQRKAEKEEKFMARERERMHTGRLIEETVTFSHQDKNGINGVNGIIQNGIGSSNGTFRSTSSSSNPSLTRSASIVSQPEPKPFSAYVNNNHATKKPSVLGGVAKRIKQKSKHSDTQGSDFKIGEMEYDGRRTIRSLSGLQRDHHVMYVKNGNNNKTQGQHQNEDSISRALSEPEFNYSEESGGGDNSGSPLEASSMFERPGFGNVAFINRRNTSGALMSLPSESTDVDAVSLITNGVASDGVNDVTTNGRLRRRGSLTDSIGTVGSLAARMKNMPWGEDDVGLDEDDVDSSPLELFLGANGLSEYLMLFSRERIDLSALMLLSDSDLKELGLPMGPRRKIMDAITRRKRTLDSPGVVMDTLL